ncbi:hypothetical protein J2W23_003847 [Variovorax boronicumulans]|uniref:Imm43 family immunity protein n=1 Tax=Variovorax boronicumulans TaxID=436515 RepID=UPI002781860F|nr:hypothetical protein [Variovorax boronicumulans]MDQ0015447.1 hypothetical protein [Variovorax boronicumulans]
MKYYAVTQKKERGCPIGYLNAVLYDHCPEHPESIQHGMVYPWYADKKNLKSFPSGMCLVVKEKLIDFSIRSDASHQYLREDFFHLLQDFGAGIQDFKEILVVSSAHKNEITEAKYFASIFSREFYLSESNAIDFPASDLEKDEFDFLALKKLKINKDVEADVFGIQNLEPKHNTIICSERFVVAANKSGVKGVDFVDLDVAKWPDVNSFSYDPKEILAIL